MPASSPSASPPDGSATPRILTVDDWINAVAKRGSAVFYERQVKVSTETWDHIAHLWSTYETRTTPMASRPKAKCSIAASTASRPSSTASSGT